MTIQVVTIQARYSGVCPDCGERWQPGDPRCGQRPGSRS